jgi:sugar O-acyltransferase (sialic acid O-acetyltransferase NeuD family)
MNHQPSTAVIVFGASGHAKVVIDIIEREGRLSIPFLVDDDLSLKGTEVYGYRVAGDRHDLLSLREEYGVDRVIVGIGSNRARLKVASWLTEAGFSLGTAVHPSAQVARGVTIGAGTVVMAGAVINSDTVIGEHVIVNTGATVDHDCRIGNGVHLAPGSILCGTVTVGEGCFVGAGGVIIPNLTLGTNVIVGAGATVVKDVPDGVMVVGTPARVVDR